VAAVEVVDLKYHREQLELVVRLADLLYMFQRLALTEMLELILLVVTADHSILSQAVPAELVEQQTLWLLSGELVVVDIRAEVEDHHTDLALMAKAEMALMAWFMLHGELMKLFIQIDENGNTVNHPALRHHDISCLF
jgi:hypothetical protein